MSFEWQTEEEEKWDAETLSSAEPLPGTLRPRRRLPALVALFLLLAVAAGFLYWRAQRQVEQAQAIITDQVLASHELLQSAASEGDQELFLNVLSGREEAWTEAQKRLLASDALFERPGLGLRLVSGQRTRVTKVTLGPELNEAEVSFRQAYALASGGQLSETVELAHNAVYRRGRHQWLYAPAEDSEAFWGAPQRYEGQRLTVDYPSRDAELVRRLAADLDGKLMALCQQPELYCSSGWHLYLTLEPDPALLLRLVDGRWEEALEGALEFSLPAPTLVGLPVDETGYQVLFDGYADYLLSTAIADLVGYDCCHHLLFARVLVEQQLVELGVRRALLPLADYPAVIDAFRPVAEVGALWQYTSPAQIAASEWRLARAFVTFLLTQTEAPIATWQRALERSRGFDNWLAQMVTVEALDPAWEAFILAKIQEAQIVHDRPALSLPEGDLLLACSTAAKGELALVRYQAENDEWLQEQVLQGKRAAVLSLLGDERLLVYRYGVPRGEPRNFLWEEGRLLPLLPEESGENRILLPVSYTPASNSLDPLSQYLVLLRWNREERVSGGYRLFDLDCAGAGCSDQPFPGTPVWSPEGSQLLVSDGRQLWRAERQALDRRLTTVMGWLPFWLDEVTYGYMSGNEVRLARSEDDQPRTVLRQSQLTSLLPEPLRGRSLMVRQLLAAAERPNVLLLVAEGLAEAQTLIFQIERPPGAASFWEAPVTDEEIKLLAQEDDATDLIAYLLDNGRFLVTSSRTASATRLRVYALTSQKMVLETGLGGSIGSLDVSPDGRWLALAGGPLIELVALAENGGVTERSFLFPPFPDCTSAMWIR